MTPPDPPVIELVTLGPSESLFSRAGHAAICSLPGGRPEVGTCNHYGVTDFSAPVRLGWNYVRGRADFYASSAGYTSFISYAIEGEGRTVWRQVIPLTPEAAVALTDRMDADRLPENRAYRYHHFDNNCTTRIRDLIDEATGGALAIGGDESSGLSWRERARDALRDDPPILAVAELGGRAADRVPTRWEAMAVPDVLREEVERRLHVVPERVHQGRVASGDPRMGRAILAGLGLLGVLPAIAGRYRAGRAIAGALSGLLGLSLVVAALISVHAEARINELPLVWWPTDLLLGAMSERQADLYARVRLVGLGIVGGLSLAGVLVQPLFAPVVMAAVPLVVLCLTSTAPLRVWPPMDRQGPRPQDRPSAQRGG